MAAILSEIILNLKMNVGIVNGLVFKWLGLRLEPKPLNTGLFEIRSSKSTDFGCFGF